MPVLNLNKVSKIYSVEKKEKVNNFFRKRKQEIAALQDISFSVNQGEVLGVIGANGSGKSTLLKILSKITKPTSGQVSIKGKTLSLLEVGTGFHPELTGRENIYLNGSLIGMTKKEIKNKISSIIDFSGISDFIDIPVKKYSSGMYVRLAFSIVAHMDPDILLIDEVLSMGDLDFQKKCMNHIKKITEDRNKVVIMVSHNLELVQNLCQNCLWLHQGQIKKIGKTHDIINSYLDEKAENKNMPISDRVDRLGNGKIKVTKIELMNEAGEKVDYFLSGQSSVFCVRYRAFDKNISDFELTLPINSCQLQNRLANIWSNTINKRVKCNYPEGMVKIKINNLPLNVGKYSYNVWLGRGGENFDHVFNAGYFNVLYGDYYKTGTQPSSEYGVILLDYDIID
jgi:lipopolysaccharide transport system ATP-binding protein